MTSKERVFCALQRKEPDRVPKLDWLIDPAVIKGVNESWSYEDVIENTVEDVAVAFWDVGMEKIEKGIYIDEWGIRKNWGVSNTYPIPISPSIRSKKDLDSFTPPDPLSEHHFETLRKLIEKFKGKKAILFFAHDASTASITRGGEITPILLYFSIKGQWTPLFLVLCFI